MVSVDPGENNIEAAKRHAAQSAVTQTIDYRNCTSGTLPCLLLCVAMLICG